VTLVLAPQDRAGLRALALHHGKATSAALRAALPAAATSRSVRATLTSLGFQVERVTPLTVDVSAPAALVQRSFGSARSVRSHSHVAQALPRLPASLRSKVTVAFGGDENRPAFTRSLTDPGPGLRTEYGVANALPTSTPGAAVATVQLSDWNAADLSTYASSVGGPAPKLTQINDSGFPAVLDSGDSLEVDLDQEAIYSIAPNARQRLYKSENQFEGMYNSLIHIADDALDGVDDNIVAASISWGFCESSIGTDALALQLYNSFEDVLSYVAAAGVTVFVASGDDGLDCAGFDEFGDPVTVPDDVSYPASSPQVVAVGGTTGTAAGRTSWDDPGANSGGSGGGVSKVFAEPSWQVTDAGVRSGRALPDIAALAGAPGFTVYSSTAGPSPGFGSVTGTSLASPVSAAAFTTSMATAAAHPFGIGNIVPELYSSAVHLAGFNDVTTSGDDGASPGTGPAAPAATGYDLSTGLGTPKWDTIATTLPGTPHFTPTAGTNGSATRYFRTTDITYRVAKSRAGAAAGTGAKYRIDDVTFTNPNCSIGVGTPAANTNPNFTGTYDVTLGDPEYVPGTGDYDGVYTFAVIENQGGACRIGLRNATVDTLGPEMSKPTIRPFTKTSTATGRMVALWSASDSLSGVAGYDVQIRRYPPASSAFTVVATLSTTATSYAFPVTAGYRYLAAVSPHDRAGNYSAYAYSAATMAYDSTNLVYSSGWSTTTSTGDFFGSARYTATAGRTAIRNRVPGSVYYLVARTGPSSGKVSVTVGGYTRTVDLYSSSIRQRIVIYLMSGTLAYRNVSIKALGTRNSKSKGNTVIIDGLLMIE
jgi:kumamolisin